MTNLRRSATSVAGLLVLAVAACSTPDPVEWRQVKASPRTYYPASFSPPPGGKLPKGNWVSDENREANYFVPEAGAGTHTAAQIHADAVNRVSPTSIPPNRNRVPVRVGFGVGFGHW